MRGASEQAAHREKGCKRNGFFKGALWPHKGDAAGKIVIKSQYTLLPTAPHIDQLKKSSAKGLGSIQVKIMLVFKYWRVETKSRTLDRVDFSCNKRQF